MERAIESEELRKALEQILELCLKTARGLRVVLEEGTTRTDGIDYLRILETHSRS